MAKTTTEVLPEADVPRETSDAEPENHETDDVPRGTSGQFQPGHAKKGGRTRQDRAPQTGDDAGESFWNMISPITPEEWRQGYSLYLYRCEPITDKRISGKEIFVKKYFEAVDPQKIMEEEGSGKYLAILNLMDPATRKGKAVYSHYFEISNLKYPPQVPLGEWVDDPRNKKWAWAKPLLEAEQKRRVLEAQGQPGMQGMDQATQMFQAAVSAVKTLRPDKPPEEQASLAHMIIQTLEKTLDKNSTTQGDMLNVVDKIISAVKPSGDGGSDIVKILLLQMDAAEKRAESADKSFRELLLKMNEPKPQQSVKEQLLDWKEIIGMFRGGSTARGGTDWPEVVKDVGGEIVKTIGAGLQFASLKKAESMKRQPPPAASNPQLTQPNASQPTATPNTSNPPNVDEQTAMIENINAQFGPMFDELAPHLVDRFVKDCTGMVFREWFIEEYGQFIYRKVRKFSVETMIAVIQIRKMVAEQRVQEVLNDLQPPEKVVQFIAEFLSDTPIEDDDDDDTPDGQATGESDF
jgi:hypothetical protein